MLGEHSHAWGPHPTNQREGARGLGLTDDAGSHTRCSETTSIPCTCNMAPERTATLASPGYQWLGLPACPQMGPNNPPGVWHSVREQHCHTQGVVVSHCALRGSPKGSTSDGRSRASGCARATRSASSTVTFWRDEAILEVCELPSMQQHCPAGGVPWPGAPYGNATARPRLVWPKTIASGTGMNTRCVWHS